MEKEKETKKDKETKKVKEIKKESKIKKRSGSSDEQKKINIIGFVDGCNRLTLAVQFKGDPKFYTVLAENLLPRYQLDLIRFLESHVAFS